MKSNFTGLYRSKQLKLFVTELISSSIAIFFICLQDELQVLKGKVKEIIEENKLLHEEIKRSAVHEILKEGLDVGEVRVNRIL